MDGFSSLNIYCNQYYLQELKKGLLRKPSQRYVHRDVQQYPFILSDETVNKYLYAKIESAISFIFGNSVLGTLLGEFWTVIDDYDSSERWGLFGFSEYQSNNGESNNAVVNYALCPLSKKSMLSRPEIIAVLRRCSLFREWGRKRIEARRNSFSEGYPRSSVLLEQLNRDRTMQLVYGNSNEEEFAFWLDQIWKEGATSLDRVSCFFSYEEAELEVFAKNGCVLPQLLLFPGEPLKQIQASNGRIRVPVRGAPQQIAHSMSISSVFGDNRYGLLLSGNSLDELFNYVKKVPKYRGEENQLRTNSLGNLLRVNTTQLNPDYLPSISDANIGVSLLRRKTNVRIPLTYFPFWIGRQVGRDGYNIVNDSLVSHRHAYISQENGRYYITDNYSKNHTFVNGTRVQGGMKIELQPYSEIRIGNERFVFTIVEACHSGNIK